MTNNKVIFLSFIVLIGFATKVCTAKYSGGNGSEANPYRISDAYDMNDIGLNQEDWASHFVLTNDIDLAQFTGTQFNIIGEWINWGHPDNKPFTGVFDGNDFAISNFTYNSTGTDRIGLFGFVGSRFDPNSEIRNLGLIDPDVNAGTGHYTARYVGSLVGWLGYGIITNCYVQGGSISGDHTTGGLAGENHEGTISNCYATIDVVGNQAVGGLVGCAYNSRGTISNCYATGSISGDHLTGGLVGVGSNISNCYATGAVNGNDYGYTGGLSGWGENLLNCYATGTVSGNNLTGGLVGRGYNILNSYATGNVNGNDDTGGLVGSGEGISNCYATGDVNGNNYAGGLVGNLQSGRPVPTSNCYATGNVNGNNYTGGLIGRGFGGRISNCYAAGLVTGTQYTGGLVGYDFNFQTSYTKCFWDSDINPDVNGIGNSADADVIGKTTAKMQDPNTFINAGWDFTTPIWKMCDTPGYPRLLWEQCPIKAHIDIVPHIINLQSEGKWITCYIRFDEGYDVTDINPDSIRLEDVIEPEQVWLKHKEMAARFSRSNVEQVLNLCQHMLTISGAFTDGTIFKGTDVITVKDKDNPNPICAAAIITVDDDGPADFNSIQPAIDSASDGDIIIVQPGLYMGVATYPGSRRGNINFLGKNIILTSANPLNPDIVLATSIGSGDGNETRVIFRGTEDESCALIGFNINGSISGLDGSIDPYGPYTHATISHCLLQGNCGACGGIIWACDGIISNCVIVDNSRHACYCIICPAVAIPGISSCNGLFINCTLTDVWIEVEDGGTLTIKNCILYNTSVSFPYLYGGTLNISYCNVQGGASAIYGDGVVNWGPGNIDTDPCFVRLGYWEPGESGWFLVEGDYHLLPDSPCIDAGDPCYIAEPDETDIDGNPRVIGGRIDMGAYEVTPLDLLLELGENLDAMGLPKGIANSLLAKLDTALQKLADDNENNDTAAINLLEAFIKTVKAQYSKKIPEAYADALIEAARDIIELLSK